MNKISMSAGILLAGLTLGSCSTTRPAPAAITPHRTIIFVWDGMRPDAISQADTPNLYAMQRAGVNFTDNHSTYPTFTMMNAASLATGAFPGTTGFYGNTQWSPGATGNDASGAAVNFQQPAFTEDYAILEDLDRFYSGQLMQVDTLFRVAQARGLKTAAVGKSGPAFLQDIGRGGVILDERHAYPASLATGLQTAGLALPKLTPIAYPAGTVTLGATNGDPTAGVAKVTLNDRVSSDPSTATTELNASANTYLMSAYLDYILPTVKPDLSLVWLRSPDSTEHAYGVGTAPFRDALHTQDALLGQLKARLTALGELDSTNIIVVSDHGHSNVAGDSTLFPLRAITAGATGAVDAATGYSVSGDVRTADLLTRAGLTAYDGNGCINDPVMSGIKADGSVVYAPRTDADGSICGKAGTLYTTPAYRVPATLAPGAFVIAANGGSDYLYQPEHDAALVAKAVKFLQSRQEYGAIFVDDRYTIPGTLPMSRVHLENASGRNPDIVVSFNFDAAATVQGFPGTEYESAGNNRGMHGSFSPTDVHNMLVASGPNFRSAFTSAAPSGNVDVAPTVAAIFGTSLPKADGRVLTEALVGNTTAPTATTRTVTPSAAATGLTVARPTDPDGKDVDATQTTYSFELKTKTLTQAGKTYTYFDSAAPVRK